MRRERRARVRPQPRHLLGRLDRLLEVADPERLEPPHRLARRRHRPAAVRVEAQHRASSPIAARTSRTISISSSSETVPTLPSNVVGVVLLDHPRAVAGDLERRRLAAAPWAARAGSEKYSVSATSVAHGAAEQRAQRAAPRPARAASQSAISMPPKTRRCAEHVVPRRVAHGRARSARSPSFRSRMSSPISRSRSARDRDRAVAVGDLADAGDALVGLDLDDRLRQRRDRPVARSGTARGRGC